MIYLIFSEKDLKEFLRAEGEEFDFTSIELHPLFREMQAYTLGRDKNQLALEVLEDRRQYLLDHPKEPEVESNLF